QVEAFVKDQDMFGISSAYAHRAYLNELLGLDTHEFQNLYLTIHDLSQAEAVARDFREGLRSDDEIEEEEPEVSVSVAGMPITPNDKKEPVQPWEGTRYRVMGINEIMEPIEQVVGVLDKIALVVFLILLFVTMVGITNTFRMIMIERTREIGTMRAFGMHKKQVKRIFLWEATLVSLLGVVTGLVLSGVLVFILGRVGITKDPAMQMFLNEGRLSFVISKGSLVLNTVLVIVISLIAAYWPAKAAAKLSPMKALGSHT
ncbi:MAG: FtsX-like permease family protein, partial [Firmicutes bacterium]|nr:FtsX-like permease family protein [Bacillota bacterium]